MDNSILANNSSASEIKDSAKSNSLAKVFMFLSILLNIGLVIAIILLLSDKALLRDKSSNQLVTITATEVQKDAESQPTISQAELSDGWVITKSLTEATNNNDINEFTAQISNYKISLTNRMLLTGQYSEKKQSSDQVNKGTVVSVDNQGDVQSLKINFANGQQLTVNAELAWEEYISYEKAIKLTGSKIPNLKRVFIGTDEEPVWRYIDDSSQLDCENHIPESSVIKQPCGSGFILLNNISIVKAECSGSDPAACDAIMKTLEVTILSN